MGCNANSNIPIILTILIQAPEKKTTSTSKPKAKKAATGVNGGGAAKTKGKSEAAKARDEARCSFGIVLTHSTHSSDQINDSFFFRKKMLEDRKRAMKEKKAGNEDGMVIIM